MLKLIFTLFCFLCIPLHNLFATCPLLHGNYLCTSKNFPLYEIEIRTLTRRSPSSSFHYKVNNILFARGTSINRVHVLNSDHSIDQISHLHEEEAFCTERNSLVIPHPHFRDKLIEYIPTLTQVLAITYQNQSAFNDPYQQKTCISIDQSTCQLISYSLMPSQNIFHDNPDPLDSEQEVDSYLNEDYFREKHEEISQEPSESAAVLATATPEEQEELPASKSKLSGGRYTEEQYRILGPAFEADPKPSKLTRVELAKETGLSIKQINTYYVNRRMRAKPKKLKGSELSARTSTQKTTQTIPPRIPQGCAAAKREKPIDGSVPLRSIENRRETSRETKQKNDVVIPRQDKAPFMAQAIPLRPSARPAVSNLGWQNDLPIHPKTEDGHETRFWTKSINNDAVSNPGIQNDFQAGLDLIERRYGILPWTKPASTNVAFRRNKTRLKALKPKKAHFPKYVKQLLESYYFEENLIYPSRIEQEKISEEINELAMDPPFEISPAQVYNWFANKRKRTRVRK